VAPQALLADEIILPAIKQRHRPSIDYVPCRELHGHSLAPSKASYRTRVRPCGQI